MPDGSNREREIFIAALDLATPAERAAFLADACGNDEGLRQRVEALLTAHDAAGGFFSAREPQTPPPPVAPEAHPGARIDRYRLLEPIGEGGFGVVYLAEQLEPVRRRVALKIIKPGMDTRAVIARFAAERQALALMDHPGIARVFDGGATETGRPYFVMELVEGVPITTFCDDRRLTTRERLELFIQVCHAVQHAHQKGVIHRDLKPSNLLVTTQDDRPMPKVIDFGIAKAIDQRLTDQTLFTRLHSFVGSPAYMSPEQTGLDGLDVDTRSDIYSLGVVLYELLTGHTPFDAAALAHASLDVIHQTIREKEPPTPSRRFTSLEAGDRTTAAQRRRADPMRLAGQLRGDLDRIVMKCLAKDRDRRYETANALALDLARHLNHEPVEARADTLTYRATKFVRRHVRGVAAAAVVLATLAGLVAFHTVRLARERDRARLEAEKAEQVSDLLAELLTGADPYRTPDPNELTVLKLLEAGVQRVEEELADQPELQADMFTVIGRVFLRLGLHDRAQPLLERALAAGRQAGINRELLAVTLIELGVLLRERAEYEAAASVLQEALELRRELYAPGDEIAYVLVELGRVYMDEGHLDRAEPLLREALALRRESLGEEHRNTAVSYGDLGVLLMRKDDFAGAEEPLRRALAINRKILGDHANVAGAMNNLAQIIANQGDQAGAEALFRESVAMFRRNVGEKHWRVANVLNNLSGPLREQGKYEEATAVLNEALAIVHASLGPDHPLAAIIRVSLGRVSLARGDFSAAEAFLRKALPVQERTYIPSHPRLAMTRSLLGAALLHQQQFEEAEALLLSAREVLKGISGPERREAVANQERLTALYAAWRRPAANLSVGAP